MPGAILQPHKSVYYLNDTVRFSCREGFKLDGAATLYRCEQTNDPGELQFVVKNAETPSFCIRKFLTFPFPFVGLLSARNCPKKMGSIF